MVVCMGLTTLARQCKFTFSFLPGTRCMVGEEACLTLGVRGVKHAVVVVCVDLTALARRCKFTFSCLPGTWCLVGEEVQLTLVVGGGGLGVLSLRIGLG